MKPTQPTPLLAALLALCAPAAALAQNATSYWDRDIERMGYLTNPPEPRDHLRGWRRRQRQLLQWFVLPVRQLAGRLQPGGRRADGVRGLRHAEGQREPSPRWPGPAGLHEVHVGHRHQPQALARLLPESV